MQIWEREASLDHKELAIEAERRDSVIDNSDDDIAYVISSPPEEASQSDLPKSGEQDGGQPMPSSSPSPCNLSQPGLNCSGSSQRGMMGI